MDSAVVHPSGTYRYVPGIDPYSGGVAAEAGYEIEHLTWSEPAPWREGFAQLADHLASRSLGRAALCAVELRCPQPHSFDGFVEFNDEYRALLDQWGLLLGDVNPVARTNVSPVAAATPGAATNRLDDTLLAACSIVVPSTLQRRTFVVAGAGDLVDQADLREEAIVPAGDAVWTRRVDQVLDEMEARMAAIGVGWGDATVVDVYCATDGYQEGWHRAEARCGDAVNLARWIPSHPPILGLTYEMDLRGVSVERLL